MSLRVRLMISLNGLLLVTVVVVSGLTLFTTIHSLRDRARNDALSTASLLASATSMALQTPPEAPIGIDAPVVTPKDAVERLVRNVVDAGNLKAMFVADPAGTPIASASPGNDTDPVDAYYGKQLDVLAMETSQTLKSTARLRDGFVEASVPLTGFGPRAGALVCLLGTGQLDAAVSAALRDILILSVAGLVAGGLVANLLARRISGPVHELATAAAAIGSGRFNHRVHVESNDEVGMLATSFNKMADSLETYTARLTKTTAEREALRREMDIAAEIQRSLLPEACPQVEGFEITAESIPAREVGGDFYDFIPLPDGRWGVVIADVAGKGVPAALLMALSRSLIRSYSGDNGSALRALDVANRFMIRDMRSETFVTCFYGVLDPTRRRFTYVNAGHNAPVVMSADGSTQELAASSPPLGVLEESGMEEGSCQLEPGDVLMMYTDGITEAHDTFDNQFGAARLGEVLRNSLRLSAEEIGSRTLAAVRSFAGNRPQFDDMTSVVIKTL